MITPNTEPIPVAQALRLCEMALEDCDKATHGPWEDSAGFVRAPKTSADMHTPEGDYGTFFVGTSALWVAECSRGEAFYNPEGNVGFIVLSRAVMRPLIEYLHDKIKSSYSEGIRFTPTGSIHGEIMALYLPLAALRDHYDKIRPDWRSR